MATQVEKAQCVVWFIGTHSATTVQRCHRNTYHKVSPTRKSIHEWRKQSEETGYLCKGKSSGRPRVVDDTVEAVRRSYMLLTLNIYEIKKNNFMSFFISGSNIIFVGALVYMQCIFQSVYFFCNNPVYYNVHVLQRHAM
jgi:hypothetical protein